MEEKRRPGTYLELKKILALVDALAALVRFYRVGGYYKVADWYKKIFDEVLPVAEKMSGCNLNYEGVNV